MTYRNTYLVGAKTRISLSNGCYVETERSTELCQVLFCGGWANIHNNVARFCLALPPTTQRLWKPYFKYMPPNIK